MTVIETIKKIINEQLAQGNKKFVVYPYGIAGYVVRRVLQESFHMEPVCVIDDYKAGNYEFIKKRNIYMD